MRAAVVLIISALLVVTATASAPTTTSGCRALTPYVADSCMEGDKVFDGFRVCCDFLDRGGGECVATYSSELAAAGVKDVSLFSGCMNFLPPV
ncbi:hypothetical protein KSP39_PZI023680 [Platanthera zijinensis]|uniref:Uncharacterized protein n=1 Tax=Platanthera zijinensis TaxID=2320716 RepID=A0AAP0AT48_9ASPA